MAVILVILGAIAGLIAARVVKKSSPPVPEMAIDEARKIRADLQQTYEEGPLYAHTHKDTPAARLPPPRPPPRRLPRRRPLRPRSLRLSLSPRQRPRRRRPRSSTRGAGARESTGR